MPNFTVGVRRISCSKSEQYMNDDDNNKSLTCKHASLTLVYAFYLSKISPCRFEPSFLAATRDGLPKDGFLDPCESQPQPEERLPSFSFSTGVDGFIKRRAVGRYGTVHLRRIICLFWYFGLRPNGLLPYRGSAMVVDKKTIDFVRE